MYMNQYTSIKFNLGSVAKNEEACMLRCIADQPNADGKTCMSIDWWINNGKCHLSMGTSCNPTADNNNDGAVKTHNDNNVVNYFEKVCACGLTVKSGITLVQPTRAYNYNSGSNTKIYGSREVFDNSRETLCPITSCSVKKSDCSTALDSDVAAVVNVVNNDLYAKYTAELGLAST
jgi:hypothetical protein